MVPEDDFMMAMVWAMAFTAWTIYLLYRNGRLKRKLLVATVSAKAMSAPQNQVANPAPPPARDDEMAEIRKRIQVLERITVEQEHSLSREIEALRVR